jgi:hypothetical protein
VQSKESAVVSSPVTLSSRRSWSLCALNALFALPAIYLAIKLHTRGIEWTYDSFFVFRIILTAMLVTSLGMTIWSVRTLVPVPRIIMVAVLLGHIVSFLALYDAFGGTHR